MLLLSENEDSFTVTKENISKLFANCNKLCSNMSNL